jgi:hypothetical protein
MVLEVEQYTGAKEYAFQWRRRSPSPPALSPEEREKARPSEVKFSSQGKLNDRRIEKKSRAAGRELCPASSVPTV